MPQATAEHDDQIVRPQAGFQETVLACDADIAIVGGAAGCGKTWVELMEPLYHVDVPAFYAVFFRRTTKQIRNPGGLWDEARTLYPLCGGVPFDEPLEYRWECGSKIKMAHLEHPSTVLDWQGAQVCLFLFDELTHFEESMFWYMLSRNRSTCGVKPYIRATCNPDADSWVAKLIAWWIDQETGLANPGRAGVIRFLARVGDTLTWGDSREEVAAKCPGLDVANDIKSLTFIPGKLDENKILLKVDPGYKGNLLAMTRVEMERLLNGNWKARKTAGSFFRRSDVTMLDRPPDPDELTITTRRWDLAASEPTDGYPDPDYTFGVKMARYKNGRFVVLHAKHCRVRANEVRALVRRTAEDDGVSCSVGIAEDPAQAGKDQAQSYATELAGFEFYADKETGDPVTRVEPCAAQWQHGNIDVVRGPWNEEFFFQLEGFPDKKVHDDAVSALDGAFKHCLADDDPFRYY